MVKTGTLEYCFEGLEGGRNVGYYAFKVKMWYEDQIYRLEEQLKILNKHKRLTEGEYKLFVNVIKDLKSKEGWEVEK